MWPRKVLMTKPIGYRVAYSINPHMSDEFGNLNQVDTDRAMSQWMALRNLFERLGLKVSVLDGQSHLPDMVFCANQTFPFRKKNGETAFIMSHMSSNFREREVDFYREWAAANGYQVFDLQTTFSFEGMGDALWSYESDEIFGGYGFRTALEVYDELEKITQTTVHRINLIDNRFYHLDTCLAIINKDTALAVREAFGPSGWDLLNQKFTNLIEIPVEEAIHNFAGNMLCVQGTDVILHKGAVKTVSLLKELKLNVHEVDTSEFMKSGGSVFCMKQLYW